MGQKTSQCLGHLPPLPFTFVQASFGRLQSVPQVFEGFILNFDGCLVRLDDLSQCFIGCLKG